MASGDTKTEALLNILGNGGDASEYKGCCNTKTQSYILDAIDRVQNVEDEVEELKNNPDVVDIVDTYADLQAYDTSKLTDKDIIRVLTDETHSGNSTYYRFIKDTNTWTFIGEVSGGVNVVQTTGTSTTDVMSQNATTSMVFADPAIKEQIQIGINADTRGAEGISIGKNASIAINSGSIAIGKSSNVTSQYSVALGYQASATRKGEVNIGSGAYAAYGYNNTPYRVLGGVHDGQNAHDAATVAQGNTLATSAPTTSTVGVLGQLYTDTTGMHTYQCTAISGDTYTWTQRW